MKRELILYWCGKVTCAITLTAAVLISVSAFSCMISPEGVTMLGGTYDCPKLVDFTVEDKAELALTFSGEISFQELRVCQESADEAAFEASACTPVTTDVITNSDGTVLYDMTFPSDFECGTDYLLYAVVADERGNTLSFSSGFCGYNDSLPYLVLSEVRTEYSNPKAEFIELYTLREGFLGGMVAEVYYGSKRNVFQFPQVYVQRGDYILLHMRTTGDGCIDEVDATDVSTSPESFEAVRDFWFPSAVKALGKTGVILLRERENGRIVDSLLYAESSKASWPQTAMGDAAQLACLSGNWAPGAATTDAVCSDKCTVTRSISRQNIPDLIELLELSEADGGEEFSYPCPARASDWIVTATSCATPGYENSSKVAQ